MNPDNPFEIVAPDKVVHEVEKTVYEADRGYQIVEVGDLGKADWCLAIIKQADARIQEARRLVAERKKALDDWLERYAKHDNETIQNMAVSLRPWVEEVVAATGGRRKTIELLNGNLKLRTGKESVSVVNADLAIAYLKEHHPELVRTKTTEEVDKVGVLALRESGEQVPGAPVLPGRDSVKIEIENREVTRLTAPDAEDPA